MSSDLYGYHSGDILRASYPTSILQRFIEHHYGIYAGRGEVIHNSKRNGRPVRTSLSEFARGRKLSLYEGGYNDYTAVNRAERALNGGTEENYNLFRNNCQHSATRWKSGHPESPDLRYQTTRITYRTVNGLTSSTGQRMLEAVGNGLMQVLRNLR